MENRKKWRTNTGVGGGNSKQFLQLRHCWLGVFFGVGRKGGAGADDRKGRQGKRGPIKISWKTPNVMQTQTPAKINANCVCSRRRNWSFFYRPALSDFVSISRDAETVLRDIITIGIITTTVAAAATTECLERKLAGCENEESFNWIFSVLKQKGWRRNRSEQMNK